MEIGGWVILAVLWALLNLMTKGKEKKTQPRARPLSLPPTTDASQQEGSRLETMLRELQRALEESAGVEQPRTLSYPRPERPGRPAPLPLPGDEDIEERESLEAEPEVVSLETDVRRAPRRRVDQDEGAEDIEAQRIQAAAARDRATTKVDHAAFDKRIRQEPADQTATRYTARQLRDAMVWREILGPPVSMRDP
ncbi:MAG TPA: hypothetical protein VF252_11325 [Gemmatimonadales bacterium]